MTISTATIAQVSDETYGFDNLAPTAGTWQNVFWPGSNNELIWGKQVGKFTFDFESIALKFSNLSPTIPPSAKIVSAILRGTATANSTAATFFTLIIINDTDGFWNLASVGPGWRSASTGLAVDADVHVLSTGLGTLVDTAIATTHAWAIRDNGAGRYLRAGQGVEVVTAGALGFVDISLVRTGAVAVGNIWAEIYSQDGAGLADTLLATSDVRAASAAPVAMAPFRFTFSGGDQIALSAGQDIVVVLNGDYPVSPTQNISIGWTAAAYAGGTLQFDGTGVAFDDQNYPLQASFRAIPNGTPAFVLWVAPQFTAGVDYDTPDLSTLLQAYIQGGSYAQGDPLAFAVAKSDIFFPPGDANRRWADVAHPTYSPVRLIVEWRERAIRTAA